VLYHGADGQVHRQRAEIVIMACNGVGTPRLLLHSSSTLFPEGLANRSGLVGKNLMFHPLTGVAGVFKEEMKGHEDLWPVRYFLRNFMKVIHREDFQGVMVCTLDAPQRQ
jgi:choline dehydrogenase-like flavoprotein